MVFWTVFLSPKHTKEERGYLALARILYSLSIIKQNTLELNIPFRIFVPSFLCVFAGTQSEVRTFIVPYRPRQECMLIVCVTHQT